MNTIFEWWHIEDRNPTFELMQLLGWQGGTIHQVCEMLGCQVEDILFRGKEKFLDLMEVAALKTANHEYLEGIFASNSGYPENPYNCIDYPNKYDSWERGLKHGHERKEAERKLIAPH